jgi:hypothetical protein
MRKLIIKIIVLTLSIICITIIKVAAQEGDTASNPYAKEFNKFKEQTQKQFDDHRDQIEKEFSDYLRQTWKQFTGKELYKKEPKPKPGETPKYVAGANPDTAKLKIIIPQGSPEVEAPVYIAPPETIRPSNEIQLTYDTLLYFGSKCVLGYDKSMLCNVPNSIDENFIADFWDIVNKSAFDKLITQIEDNCRFFNVNDWGYYLMAKKVSEDLYPNSQNGKILLRWYLLTRMGYKTKLGLADGSVFLLLPFTDKVYNCGGISINGMHYYNVESVVMRFRTFEKDFPNAVKQMDMTIKQPLNIALEPASKTVKLEYEGTIYPLKIKYNKNIVNYFNEYPKTLDLKVYFNSLPSLYFKESLAETFKPILKGKSERDAVDMLLSFMHQSFQYKTDQEQFGYEKFNFAEESLFYPYIDCDDRGILFSYMVRQLTDLEVIGLDYPTHVSDAVHFNENVEGNTFLYNSKKYISCDPTYMGATVGMMMPIFDKVVPKVIPVNNERIAKIEEDRLWEMVNHSGGYNASSQQNIVLDKDGNKYIAGYYADSAKFGSVIMIKKGMKCGFIAKYSRDNQLIWIKTPTCVKNSLFNYISINNEGLYTSGFFENAMTIGNKKLNAPLGEDVFIARFDFDGNLKWAEKANFDTLKESTNALYVVKLDEDGVIEGVKFYENDENATDYGISFDNKGMVYLTSTTNNALSFKEKFATRSETADVATLLKAENDKLIGLKYEKGIAGLFAAINLIKDNRAVLPGKEVKKALDKYNPSFKNSSPKIYEALGNITFIANNNGIIIVQTVDGDDILIDKIKMESDAKIKINILANGDAVIDVLSGVKVGKVVVWYKMNFIKLFKTSGDLLFDYDSDHTQKRVNLKKDILY